MKEILIYNMTESQLKHAHAILGLRSRHSTYYQELGEYRYLNDGDIVRFTKCVRTYENAEFEINDKPDWKIWFSQLNQIYLFPDLSQAFKMPFIYFSEIGIQYIPDLNVDEFCTLVKGREFKVYVDSETFGAINLRSSVWHKLPDDTYATAYQFIVDCIENDNLDDLGDLVKVTKLYNLIEVT